MAIPLEFGGKSRDLFFGLKEIKQLEAALPGGAIGDVMGLLARYSFTGTAIALYIGLKDHDPTLNQNLVDRMLWKHAHEEGRPVKPIIDALSAALDETGLFKPEGDPEATEDGEGNAPGRRRSRSGASGPNKSASGSSD